MDNFAQLVRNTVYPHKPLNDKYDEKAYDESELRGPFDDPYYEFNETYSIGSNFKEHVLDEYRDIIARTNNGRDLTESELKVVGKAIDDFQNNVEEANLAHAKYGIQDVLDASLNEDGLPNQVDDDNYRKFTFENRVEMSEVANHKYQSALAFEDFNEYMETAAGITDKQPERSDAGPLFSKYVSDVFADVDAHDGKLYGNDIQNIMNERLSNSDITAKYPDKSIDEIDYVGEYGKFANQQFKKLIDIVKPDYEYNEEVINNVCFEYDTVVPNGISFGELLDQTQTNRKFVGIGGSIDEQPLNSIYGIDTDEINSRLQNGHSKSDDPMFPDRELVEHYYDVAESMSTDRIFPYFDKGKDDGYTDEDAVYEDRRYKAMYGVERTRDYQLLGLKESDLDIPTYSCMREEFRQGWNDPFDDGYMDPNWDMDEMFEDAHDASEAKGEYGIPVSDNGFEMYPYDNSTVMEPDLYNALDSIYNGQEVVDERERAGDSPLDEKYTQWALDDRDPSPMMAKYISDLFDSEPELTGAQLKALSDAVHSYVDNEDLDEEGAELLESGDVITDEDTPVMNRLSDAYGQEAKANFAKLVDIINPDFEYDDRIVQMAGEEMIQAVPTGYSFEELVRVTNADLEFLGVTGDSAAMDWIDPIEFDDIEDYIYYSVVNDEAEAKSEQPQEVHYEQLELNLDGLEDSKGLQQ